MANESSGELRGLRVLYVHNSGDIYGASRSLLRLIPEMQRRGVVPYVLLPEIGPLTDRIKALGVEVITDRWLTVIDRALFRVPKLAGLFLRVPVSVFRLFRIIRGRRIDLVHTNTGVMPSAALAARLAGVPHLWHVRDSFLEFRSLWKCYRRYITGLSAKVICVSNPIAAQFGGAINVEVVHNGISSEEFSEQDERLGAAFRERHGLGDEFVAGCVGRIKFVRKGQEILIQAASQLRDRGLMAKCLVVGAPWPGNEEHLERLRQLICDLRLEEQVVMTGELADVRAAYAAMDVFVLPSAQPEPFGGVVLEAMAMERAVIATAIGGSLDQVADGETGYLIPPGEPAALADKLAVLMQHPELREQMGRAGRERLFECFSMERMVGKFERIYSDAVRKQ